MYPCCYTNENIKERKVPLVTHQSHLTLVESHIAYIWHLDPKNDILCLSRLKFLILFSKETDFKPIRYPYEPQNIVNEHFWINSFRKKIYKYFYVHFTV